MLRTNNRISSTQILMLIGTVATILMGYIGFSIAPMVIHFRMTTCKTQNITLVIMTI